MKTKAIFLKKITLIKIILFLDIGKQLLMVKKFGTTFNNKKVLSNLGVKIYLVIYIL